MQSNLLAFAHMNDGECCQLWVLHQPWPRAPPPSNLLERLREPQPLSPRCRYPGRKTRPSTKSTRHCKESRTRANPAASARRRDRASKGPRRHHKRASGSTSATGARCCKEAQTRVNTSPVCYCESRCTKTRHLGGSSLMGCRRGAAERGDLKVEKTY